MELEKKIQACKNNKYEMNNFIEEYKPFIAKIVGKQVGRYVEYGKDDELSIGLIAFEEAVRSYNKEKGTFLSFAESVIRKRLIDYFRKENKHNKVIPLSAFYIEQEETEVDVTEKQSIELSNQLEENQYRRYEILEIQRELKKWGISFFDLPNCSPKHEKTREEYKQIINAIINNSDLLVTLKEKKYLPVAEIEKITGINRKVIERARKYIIALVIILTGEYRYVQSFINWGGD